MHVCLFWSLCQWLLRTGRTTAGRLPLAGRGEREEGREGAREEGERVDEVSKDSWMAELYLFYSTIWTVSVLHFNKSIEVKCFESTEKKTHVDSWNCLGAASLSLLDGLVWPRVSLYLQWMIRTGIISPYKLNTFKLFCIKIILIIPVTEWMKWSIIWDSLSAYSLWHRLLVVGGRVFDFVTFLSQDVQHTVVPQEVT